MTIKEWLKKRKNIFFISIPNILILYLIIDLIYTAKNIPDISLRLISILLLVIIFELVVNTWINMEYYEKILNKL